MKALWLVGALALGGLLGFAGAAKMWGERYERQRVESASTDSLVAIQSADIAHLEAEVTRLLAVGTQVDTIRLPARRPVPIPSTVVPDSRTVTLESFDSDSALIDTLLREQAVLHDRIGRDSVKLASFALVVGNQRRIIASHDTALAAMRTDRDKWKAVAEGKPRGIKLFGIRLCPVVGASYSVIPGVGQGFGGSITQPLSCD